MKIKPYSKSALMLGLTALSISQSRVSAATTIIVEDTFSRAGALAGSSPDIGAAWVGGGASWTTNGSELATSSNGFAHISVGSLAPNQVYTLSMDLSVSGFWIGFGFGNPSTTAVNGNADASLLHRGNPAVQLYTQPSGSVDYVVAGGFPKLMEIVIETGATLANSTASWSVNGLQVGPDRPIDASQIDRVFINEFGSTTGTIDNFRLVSGAAVPEPSSLLLTGLGMLGMLYRRR